MADQIDSGAHRAESPENPTPEAQGRSWKKSLLFVLKLTFTIGALVWVYRKVVLRDSMEEVGASLAELRWGWLGVATSMLLVAMTFADVARLLHARISSTLAQSRLAALAGRPRRRPAAPD